jgi:hypothetical protein
VTGKEDGMSKTVRWMIPITMVLLMVTPGSREVSAQAPTPAPTPAPGQPEQQAAHEDITSEIELTRAAIQVRRQALVTAVMDLDTKEADAFWPLYREYRAEMAKVGDRFVNLLIQYGDNYDTLSDEQAGRMLDEYLAIEKARNGIKKKYVSRFRKVLPTRKVTRFFQADNKFDVLINAELAAGIPLVR